MTARGRIEYDPTYTRDRIVISDGQGKHVGVNDRGTLVWVGTEQPEVDYPLPSCYDEEILRALYEALAAHFGGAGHDTRALRQDYNAERARVDKMIDGLLTQSTTIVNGGEVHTYPATAYDRRV